MTTKQILAASVLLGIGLLLGKSRRRSIVCEVSGKKEWQWKDNSGGLSGIVVVTGGSRGIGAAVCRKLGEMKCKVVVAFRTHKAKAEEVVNYVQQQGGKAVAIQVNIGSTTSCVNLFTQVL